MTKVYCTDMDCLHNRVLTCQRTKIRLVLDDHRRQPERWICGDSKFPADTGRKDPLESYMGRKKTKGKGKIPGRKKKTG